MLDWQLKQQNTSKIRTEKCGLKTYFLTNYSSYFTKRKLRCPMKKCKEDYIPLLRKQVHELYKKSYHACYIQTAVCLCASVALQTKE